MPKFCRSDKRDTVDGTQTFPYTPPQNSYNYPPRFQWPGYSRYEVCAMSKIFTLTYQIITPGQKLAPRNVVDVRRLVRQFDLTADKVDSNVLSRLVADHYVLAAWAQTNHGRAHIVGIMFCAHRSTPTMGTVAQVEGIIVHRGEKYKNVWDAIHRELITLAFQYARNRKCGQLWFTHSTPEDRVVIRELRAGARLYENPVLCVDLLPNGKR